MRPALRQSRSIPAPVDDPFEGLRIESLDAGYSGIPVIRDFSFCCGDGRVVSLIGPNGAGKTTLLNAIAGVLRPTAGGIALGGESLTGKAPYKLSRLGVAFIPSDRGVFPSLTVAEHLRLATRSSSRQARSESAMDLEQALALFPSLQRRMNARASTLSGGEQQMLAITKAVMLGPRLLLVDELSLGLAPKLLQDILPVIRTFADQSGAIVVLVEQHYELALEISDRCIVLTHGDVVFEGQASELRGDRERVEGMYMSLSADDSSS